MFDFNNVAEATLIPANTIAKARLTLKPGDSPDDKYLKVSRNGGTYLDCEFVITEGEYAKRKVFHKIGILGNETWVEISRRFIKNLLESANGLSRYDKSPDSEKFRKLESWGDLDGLEVLIKIGIEEGGEFPDKNKVLAVITAENPVYKQMMEIPW